MKNIIYIYILDTLADWEIGYILQAVSLQNMLKEPKYTVKTVARTKQPIKTLGGLTITPDCTLEEIEQNKIAALLLSGANTWTDNEQKPVLNIVVSYIQNGILVGAICGATLALAELGILNNHFHTSNSLEYLTYFSKNYSGKAFFRDELSVADGNIITASSAGGLLWAKQIIEYLDVYPSDTSEAWYQYYMTGNAKYYAELLSTFK